VLFICGQGIAGDPLDQPVHADGLVADRYQGVSAQCAECLLEGQPIPHGDCQRLGQYIWMVGEEATGDAVRSEERTEAQQVFSGAGLLGRAA
jgi:hypothetical protein